MVCGASNSGVQNWVELIDKMDLLQENCYILWIDIAWGLQKLGIILEHKVSPNLELAKDCINKSCLPSTSYTFYKKIYNYHIPI